MALALTATCASEAASDSPALPGAEQEQGQTAGDSMTQYQGLTVEDIRWPSIPSEVDQKRWRDLVPQKAGEPLDRDLIRESIHKLHDTGRFADIRVEGERILDGKIAL